jgi:hypothetical protein
VEKYLLESKALAIGDILKGKIIEVKGEGKSLVDFGKFRAVADIKFEVKEGDKINAEVVETRSKSGKIILNIKNTNVRINSGQKEIITKIQTLREAGFNKRFVLQIEKVLGNEFKHQPKIMELPAPVKKNLVKVKEFFTNQEPVADTKKVIVFLKKTVKDSGVFFEKKLQKVLERLDKSYGKIVDLKDIKTDEEIKSIIKDDLKSNLVKIRGYFNELKLNNAEVEVQKSINLLKSSIEELLNRMKNQQDGAVKKFQNNEPILILNYSLPCKNSKGDSSQQMKIYLKRNKDRKGNKSGHRISVLLDMNRLGKIRSDLFLLENDLSITFFVEDEEMKEYFDSKLVLLRENIADSFSRLNIKSIVSRGKIKEFETEDIDQIISTESLIDLRI